MIFLVFEEFVDGTVFADVLEERSFGSKLAKPVNTVVHDKLVVRILYPLVNVINLVFLFIETERCLHLHEPRLNRHK